MQCDPVLQCDCVVCVHYDDRGGHSSSTGNEQEGGREGGLSATAHRERRTTYGSESKKYDDVDVDVAVLYECRNPQIRLCGS